MNLFNRKAATVTEEISGTEAIRRRTKSRLDHGHLSRTANDLQIALPQLESFAWGTTAQLPEAAMHKLCKEMYPHNTRWDPAADKLIDTTSPPAPMGVMPDRYDPRNNANPIDLTYSPMKQHADPPVRGNQQPAPTKRPGFA